MTGRSLRPVVALLWLLGMASVQAEPSYVDLWGPAIGSKIPVLEANDQDGKPRTLANLTGEKGLLLIFNRSVDW